MTDNIYASTSDGRLLRFQKQLDAIGVTREEFNINDYKSLSDLELQRLINILRLEHHVKTHPAK